MLIRTYLGIIVDTRLRDVLVVRCVQELHYCRKLRDAIDTNMDIGEEDANLHCCFFGKPNTNMCHMGGKTH